MSIKRGKLLKKRNAPPSDQAWIWLTREMLESDAWRSLSINARRVIERVQIEHMAHAGQENGNLPVTYNDFEKHGVQRRMIKLAIAEATACGLIVVVEQGRPSRGTDRWPSKYALGWLPLRDGASAPNRWKAWTWAKPDRAGRFKRGEHRSRPYKHNIDSSAENRTRESGGNAGSLVRKTAPAARAENRTRELADTLSYPPPQTAPGKKTSKPRERLPNLAKAMIVTALAEARAAVSEGSRALPSASGVKHGSRLGPNKIAKEAAAITGSTA